MPLNPAQQNALNAVRAAQQLSLAAHAAQDAAWQAFFQLMIPLDPADSRSMNFLATTGYPLQLRTIADALAEAVRISNDW